MKVIEIILFALWSFWYSIGEEIEAWMVGYRR